MSRWGAVWPFLSVVAVAVAMTALFWPTLWSGGGLIGGDIYYYYFPQKAYYAECLRQGELPLWNNRVGNGYPQLAESQTGVLYPFNLLLYRFCDLNTAFNASLLLHYIIAFVGCWLYARQIGQTRLAALFAALVYTYSWFPPRISLEWSIVGGAWLPLALWCVESFLQRRQGRYLAGLAVVLALQLLAGHFLIAFITQLTLVLYTPGRLWAGTASLPAETRGQRVSTALAVALACGLAFALAAVQLLPTWELKRSSQRVTVTEEHNPGYGYIPPRYLTQLFLPWEWYLDDQGIQAVQDPAGPRTNRVEAHLYLGMVPLLLVLWGGLDRASSVPAAVRRLWLLLGGAAMVYTTGCLVPVTNHLPGFSFFEGPGRYGIVTTLAGAVLAGAGFDAAWRNLGSSARLLWLLTAFGATTADLWYVSRLVTHAVPVSVAPASLIDRSPIRQYLATRSEPVRMLNEGKNLPSMVGAGTYPVYLGLSPSQYYDPALAIEEPWPFRDAVPTPGQLDWLRRYGVTHILSLVPVPRGAWPADQIWVGADASLNPPLARSATSAFYLYELQGSRGRVAWSEGEGRPAPRLVEYGPQRVVIETEAEVPGKLILTDLLFPGWEVTIDGGPAGAELVEQVFRGVEVPGGKHTIVWTYVPRSLYWGATVSGLALLILLATGHMRFWHPHLFFRWASRGGGPLSI